MGKASTPEELVVGVHISPPFVMEDEKGRYTGMAIELWELVASVLNLRYRYEKLPSVKALVESTETGQIDVAVTNLTITEDRIQRIDFTHPWYDAGLRIMVDKYDRVSLVEFMVTLYASGQLHAYAWLALVVMVSTAILTMFDRHFDDEFPTRWRDGIAESFYTVMSVASSGRPPHRKNLFGWIGRIWQGLWLITGIAVLAYVTSSVTSVMTTLTITKQISSVADLPGKRVGVLTGSVGQAYANRQFLRTVPYEDIDNAVEALAARKIDAIIGDAPVLEYYIEQKRRFPIEAVGPIFAEDKYGFGLPYDSDLTRPLSVEIISEHDSGRLKKLRERYFGERQ